VVRQVPKDRRVYAPADAAPAAPAAVQPPPDLAVGNTGASTVLPLAQTASLGKTRTKPETLPSSVQIIPRDVINQEGGNSALDAITKTSGIV
jgi:iron complex outermembrane recepter protein